MSQLSNSDFIISATESVPVSIQYDEEFQLNNFLEEPFKKLIFPLYLMHYITLTAKYKIRYGFITSNEFRDKVLCLFVNICVYVAYSITLVNGKKEDINLVAYILDLILFFIGFTYNFLDGILQSGMHTKLVLTIQKAQNAIGCFDKMNKNILISNWCTVGAVYTFYVIHILVSYVTNRFEYSGLLRLYVILGLDTSIIYAHRMMVLLTTVVKLWISKIEDLNLLKHFKSPDKRNNQLSRWRNAEKSYTDIIDAFNIYKSLINFPFLYFVLMNFMEILISLEKIIGGSDYGLVGLGFSVVWTIKNVTQIAAISLECDQFYATVVNAYLECLYHVNFRYCSARSRILCKRVLHESIACRPLNAYGLCVVDATLPLRYLSAITTYTVVLLQLHFH